MSSPNTRQSFGGIWHARESREWQRCKTLPPRPCRCRCRRSLAPRRGFRGATHQGLSCVRGGHRRNGWTKRSLPLPTSTIRPRSPPPAGRRGRLERGARMLLPRGTIAVDGRHARNVLRCSDASAYSSDDLCPLPSAVASRLILPISPTYKCLGGHDKDDNG